MRTKLGGKVLWIFGVLALFTGVAFWLMLPKYLRAPRMEILVLDGQTRNPVAGASVQVNAEVEKAHTWFHGTDTQLIHSYTAVTDTEGRFVSPAWGPIRIPSGWHDESSFSPSITVEKEGYQPQHYGSGGGRSGPDWTGTIALKAEWDRNSILLFKVGVRHSHNEFTELLPWDNPN